MQVIKKSDTGFWKNGTKLNEDGRTNFPFHWKSAKGTIYRKVFTKLLTLRFA